VLIGKQGAGKSTAISALAPLDETFVEINLQTRDADQSRQLRGKLVGEIAELRGLHDRNAEDIKSFMSRTFENWVPKYKEFETTFKRRLTFWGTSNEKEFLSDHTGNRRWLPVEIKQPNADLVKQDRDQIWAEAIWIYRNHGILWKEVQALAPSIHEEHVFQDPVRSSIEHWILNKDASIPITIKNYYNSTLRAASVEISVKESRAIGRALTALGYTGRNQRIDNVIQRVYTKE
jgi:predicted P-loop ATPase